MDAARFDENSKLIIVEVSYTNPQVIATTVYEDKQMPRQAQVYRSLRGSEPNVDFGADFVNICTHGFFNTCNGSHQFGSSFLNVIAQFKILRHVFHFSKLPCYVFEAKAFALQAP